MSEEKKMSDFDNASKFSELSMTRRFVKDNNLPIPVSERPWLDYFIKKYEDEFGSLTSWDCLVNDINRNFGGNPDLFLDYYSKVRDEMIDSIKESKLYEKFNDQNNKLSQYDESFFPQITTKKFYNEEKDGKVFLSIDLSKANFYALYYDFMQQDVYTAQKLLGVSYLDWMQKFTNNAYIISSKYTRQVIFGQLNPARTIKVEKWLIGKIGTHIYNELTKKGHEVIPVYKDSDEVIFEIQTKHGLMISFKKYYQMLDDVSYHSIQKIISCVPFKYSLFQLEYKEFETYNGKKIPVYLKHEYYKTLDQDKRSTEIKMVPSFYYAQVYSWLKGVPIQEEDLLFEMEGQVAKFIHPIKVRES